MTVIKLFISIALPTLAGYALLNLIMRRKRLGPITSLGLSYGLGLGLLTHWMLLLDVVGVRYNVGTIGIPLLALSIFASCSFFMKRTPEAPEKPAPAVPYKNLARAVYILLGLYLFYYLFYIFWRALNVPVSAWDALSTVAYKAKVFFYEGCLFHLKKHTPWPSYPLLVSLAETWVAFILGAWSDQYIKVIFPVSTLSFLVICHYFLSSYTNKRWALLGTAMLVSSNLLIMHSTIAYMDLFLAFYGCTAIMLLCLWLDKKDDSFLILASLYAGFATFTKMEGTAYLFIFTALFFLVLLRQKIASIKENIIKSLKFIGPSFGICLSYYLYKIVGKFPGGRKTGIDFTPESMSRVPIILKGFWEELFLSGNWNIVWFLSGLSLVVGFAKIKKRPEVKLLLVTLMMFFGLYFMLSLFTTEFIYISGKLRSTGLPRFTLHFFPLSVLFIVLLNYPGQDR